MKKILCFAMLVALIFTFAACDVDNPQTTYLPLVLRNPAQAIEVPYDQWSDVKSKVNDVMVPYTADFASTFLESEKDNSICSPLTAYFGLSLAAEISRGKTQEEILSALKLSDVNSLRECADTFFNASIKEIKLDNQLISKQTVTNSLWLDPDISYNKATLQDLADYHHAFSVGASFRKNNAESNKAINDFIYRESNKLLQTNFQFDENTIMLLVSTLYVKDLWNVYNDLNFTDDVFAFRNADGTSTDTKLLMSGYAPGKMLKTETYKSFFVESSSSYRLHFVVPNGGDICDVMTSQTITEVLTDTYTAYDEQTDTFYETNVLFPEFTVENNVSVLKTLNKMGITTAFSEKADLTGLLNGVDQAYFSDALQANKLAVNKKGFEGASVFIIPAAGEAAPPEKLVQEILTVDRSFGFILTDCFNIPLFVGIIRDI